MPSHARLLATTKPEVLLFVKRSAKDSKSECADTKLRAGNHSERIFAPMIISNTSFAPLCKLTGSARQPSEFTFKEGWSYNSCSPGALV